MKFSKLLGFLLTAGALYGCSASVDENKEESVKTISNLVQMTSLRIESIQKIRESETSLHTITAKSYTMKACFKEKALGKKIQFKDVILEGKSFPKSLKSTDVEGCVTWEEFTEMDYTRSRGLIEYTRKISIADTNLSREINFGIDPLEDKLVRLDHSINRTSTIMRKMDASQIIDIAQINAYFKSYTTPQYGSIPVVGFKANIKTCLRVGASADRLQGEEVEATLTNLETGEEMTIPQKTDNFGCVDLTFDSSYERYSVPRYIPYNLSFKAVNPSFMGVTSEREICLSPWQPNGIFGHDTRSGACPENPIQRAPKLHFNDVRYVYMGNKDDGFNVNKYLDMEMTKSFLIRLHPVIDYGHNFSNERHYSQIYSGRFKLNFILLSPKENHLDITEENIDDWQVLSGDEKEVEIVDGVIKQRIDLPLSFHNLSRAVHRTYGVIMLSPTRDSEYSDLKPVMAAGLFDAAARHFGTVLQTSVGIGEEFKTNFLSEKLYGKFKNFKQTLKNNNLKSNWKASPLEVFYALHNKTENYDDLDSLELKMFNKIWQHRGIKLSEKDFKDLTSGLATREQKRNFCQIYYIENLKSLRGRALTEMKSQFRDCTIDPDKFFNFKSFEHIIAITGKAEKNVGGYGFSETDRLNVNTGFCMNYNNSTRFSTSKRIGTDLGIGMKIPLPLDALSIGGGMKLDYSMMWGTDESTGSSNRGCVNRNKNLNVDKLSLRFKARTKSCLLVQVKEYDKEEYSPSWFDSNTRALRKVVSTTEKERIHLCANKDEDKEISENWYFIGEEGQHVHPLRDKWDIRENMLHKVIRGEANYTKWMKIMTDETKKIFLVKKDKFEDPMKYFDSIYSNDINVPLMYDSAIPGSIWK
ncbi:hypothetical protein HBN50_08015 [Halobacteriovorax sp. GB3]|uniref:hypothetical protein n=1 Tax=Halobacteriovorax sp. GB3 TaxID=2719615 RepID=UPI0023619422|nr:hypothetical protein [Halobacteriovorax sp. GB3]MDD0853037.1 hypothetical protein [Halobacteriovorax sp. GB3]